ncbi:MAG: phosphoenolpyruvate synthase [Gammaproteobacteria bacterium]|nr:phosphoenolpyruvate synthase [Gammaproteobacteria bacterium]
MAFTKKFAEINLSDIGSVGGKNASLGEMYQGLNHTGVNIPNGFALTAQAYFHFLDKNDLRQRLKNELDTLDINDTQSLARCGAKIRHWIRHAKMPPELADEIRQAYKALEEQYGPNPDVAVRSSATAEDLPNASFAGQQESYLNIRGSLNLIHTCQQVFASLFTDRAIAYREHQGFDHMSIGISVGVQKMVRSDKAASGVMFTIDTESGFNDVVFITAAYGLGENIVQGAVNPDEYYVFKPTLRTQHRAILKRQRGDKAMKMVYTNEVIPGHSTRNVPVSIEDRERFAITDNEVLQLASYAIAIEDHYSKKNGRKQPMDIEWAKDGEDGELYIVQARPETVESQRKPGVQQNYELQEHGTVLVEGKSVGHKIASGRARVILDPSQMNELQPGEVLVTDITDPDWEPIMKRAAGIITNRGGRTCHAAIVARELGIPAVVGCNTATRTIEDDAEVTLSCAQGDTGYVYSGQLRYKITEVDLSLAAKPRTKLMLNLGNPEQAFKLSQMPVAGVGLARLEFIINNSIGIHPQALLKFNELDAATQQKINHITFGYADKVSFYVDRLAEGVGTIAAAFYPRPVIVRLSDFKSNEYASLLGGQQFEPQEENPMIGFRGASRYPSAQFAQCFALECAAMRKVREEMGLDNVALMIPFVRTIDEARKVTALLAENGLRRGEKGLKVYLMCEIPANALLADQFLQEFDGFSIGSNDLTQLTLGVDRDSSMVSHDFDERNEAVLALMDMAIRACQKANKYIGICGQAPSDYPEITRWLVQRGIESISLNPDSILSMTQEVLRAEEEVKSH